MDILWAGGVNNPMDSIEQISYLLFLRLLSERDEQFASLQKSYKRIFSGSWARYAWGNFITLTGLTFDAILANPPFAGKIQKESILADINLETRDTELLFLKWFLDHLDPGGCAGVIVPNGVPFGSNKADRKVRELLLTSCDLQAVVNLPSGIFKPYSGVGTAALIFEKGGPKFGGTKSVWFYDLTADGFSLDDKRTPVEANDIPDVLAKWPKREEGPNSYCVPIERIKEHDWSLSAGRYKPVAVEAVTHDEPKKILKGILALESEITQRAENLFESISE